jgi:hypothetical protein
MFCACAAGTARKAKTRAAREKRFVKKAILNKRDLSPHSNVTKGEEDGAAEG